MKNNICNSYINSIILPYNFIVPLLIKIYENLCVLIQILNMITEKKLNKQ